MNKKQKGILIVAALYIFSFFPVFSGSLDCDNTVKTDFTCSKPKIENSIQEYLLDNQQDESETSVENTLHFVAESSLSEKLHLSPYEQRFSNHKTHVLRC